MAGLAALGLTDGDLSYHTTANKLSAFAPSRSCDRRPYISVDEDDAVMLVVREGSGTGGAAAASPQLAHELARLQRPTPPSERSRHSAIASVYRSMEGVRMWEHILTIRDLPTESFETDLRP